MGITKRIMEQEEQNECTRYVLWRMVEIHLMNPNLDIDELQHEAFESFDLDEERSRLAYQLAKDD